VRRRRGRVEAERAQPVGEPVALGDGEARVRAHPREPALAAGERRERRLLGRVRHLERPAGALHRAHHVGVADAVADAQPGEAERLAERAQGEHAPPARRLGGEHLGRRPRVGEHVLGVRLVEQHQPARPPDHAQHELARERRARRVVGRAQVDDGRVAGEQRVGVGPVVAPGERHAHRHQPVGPPRTPAPC
jgi:hypothetical protein